MSSRREKEKRLRPRNDPYKRNHFDQTRYLRVPLSESNKPEELNEFIESMQQTDIQKIQKFFETMPKISKKVEFHCKKCGYKEDIVIEGLQNFFG